MPLPYPAATDDLDVLGEAPDDTSIGAAAEERRAIARALYGATCPVATELDLEKIPDGAWASWARELWASRRAAMAPILFIVARNRAYFGGRQWLTSRGPGRPFEEPPKSRDTLRLTCNVIRPALNLRAEIVSEQRPGFRFTPTSRDRDKMKKAQAAQAFTEHEYTSQKMQQIQKALAHWAFTDGVAFVEQYWEPDAGPWYDLLPTPDNTQRKTRLGDLRSRVVRIEEVRVSPNATATESPQWMVIRRILPIGDAVALYGENVAKTAGTALDGQAAVHEDVAILTPPNRTDDRLLETESVECFTVYCEPDEHLFPEGLHLNIVGNVAAYIGPLLFGLIPVSRFTDGSTDPAYFPEPVMNDWVEDQTIINMVASKLVESVRKQAGGTLMTRPNAIQTETQFLGSLSLVEVSGAGALSETVAPLPTPGVGADAMNLLTFYLKQFEGKSGWNDTTRGSFSSDQSGKAILAIREQVERIFAPCVGAFAEGMRQWAAHALAGGRAFWTVPRQIALHGAQRLDLVSAISQADLDGVSECEIDAETMMPMPRSLRLFLMDKDLERGLLDPQQYRRMAPYAFVRDLDQPDEDDAARAYRVAELIRQGIPWPQLPPALPVDNAAIHMDILRREILLDDTLPEPVRATAFYRYEQYRMMLMPPMMPAPMAGGAGGRGKPGRGMDPREAPLALMAPSIAAAPQLAPPGAANPAARG